MPPIKPLPPDEVRALLEKRGYNIIYADEYNWWFAANGKSAPVVVPHAVDLIPLELVSAVVRAVGNDKYFNAIRGTDPWGTTH